MSNEQDDRWYVQFDSQEVRLMTLDELDEAFQKGLVHDETYVIPVGGSDWQTLGEILGGGDEESETQAEPAVAAPVSAPRPAFAAPAPFAASPPSARSPQAPAPSAWPPISVAPSRPVVNSGIQSVVPVVQDVYAADDLDAAQFKPKKTKLALVGAVALAAIGGLGVAIARLDTPPAAQAAAPAAAPTVEPPTASRKEASFTSTPTPDPAPAPVAAAPSEEKKEDSASGTSSSKFSDDMKKALLAQDQERAEKKKSRSKASSTTRRASSGSKGGSTPFKASGSAHDPLNGKL